MPRKRRPHKRASIRVRFLLVSGRPLREPIAWHGPIVMNTQDQIRQALTDLRSGTFIKN
jgi:quercetin 2,3-dioxygenase